MKLILHSYRRCPFCIRTRILLYLKGLEYEVVEEPLREWTPWMKDWTFATGERARVPVLRYVLDVGVEKIIPESNEINLFVDSMDGNPEYTPERDTYHSIHSFDFSHKNSC
jgi:glutathione S-transferase